MAEEHEKDSPETGSGDASGSGMVPEPPGGETTPEPRKRMDTFVHPLGNARPLMSLGFEILGSILGLGGVGWLIDYWLNTFPWFFAIGMILGIIGGLYNAVKKALNVTNSDGYEYHYKKRRNKSKGSGKDQA